MRITEENVVDQLKLKNDDCVSFILQKYGGLLNGIIRKYLHGNAKQPDIEECIADVLVSIWFHIDSFDPKKNEFKQWIAAIAKYKAIDYARKSQKEQMKRSKLELQEKTSRYPYSEPCISEVESLLNQLSDTERIIFEKYYVEGVQTKEIASEFQARESWVHNKLSRGRKKLKSFLIKGGV